MPIAGDPLSRQEARCLGQPPFPRKTLSGAYDDNYFCAEPWVSWTEYATCRHFSYCPARQVTMPAHLQALEKVPSTLSTWGGLGLRLRPTTPVTLWSPCGIREVRARSVPGLICGLGRALLRPAEVSHG